MFEQPHRTAYAITHFHAVGLCGQVTIYKSHRATHKYQGDLAIWRSHRAVAQHALANGTRRVLIMEDDVAFRRQGAEIATRIDRALKGLSVDWWGLYLGHLSFQAYFVARGLLRTRSTLAHAYIANMPLLEWLANTRPMAATVPMWRYIGLSIDSAFSNLPKMYSVFPIIAVQKHLGGNRINTKIDCDGRRRRMLDPERWRNLVIFNGTLVAEIVAILGAPFHWLTMDWFISRIEQGLSRDAASIRASGLFDDAFYLKNYPDVAEAEQDPLLHYVWFGASEGRWPNASFDPQFYAAHARTLRKGNNPLLHYIGTGRQLRLPTHPDTTSRAAPFE